MYQCREDKTRFPGFLCPDYAGFLGMTENHFFDALASVLNDPNVDCRYVLRVISRKKDIETQIIIILCLAIFILFDIVLPFFESDGSGTRNRIFGNLPIFLVQLIVDMSSTSIFWVFI